MVDPVRRALAGETHAPFQGQSSWGTPSFFGILMHPGNNGLPRVVRGDIRGPAVSEARHPAQHDFRGLWILAAAHPEPDGNRALHWEGIQARMGDVMPVPVKVYHLLRPQGSQYRDLFGAAASPGMEVLAQSFVFYLVPTHTNAQPQTTAAEHVHLGCLFGD